MELSWLMKLRIAAAAAVGIALIGILGWWLAGPAESLGVICASAVNFNGKLALLFLAFVAGIIAYCLSWPYGREIGILAAPFGLAVWAVRFGSVSDLMQLNPTVEQRQALLATFKWGSVFWLAVVAAGFAGVLLMQKILPSPWKIKVQKKSKAKLNKNLSTAIALIFSILVAQFCIKIFAQDIQVFDDRVGLIVAQPSVGQVVFAVLMSFGIVAFIIKRFLDVSYIWSAIACVFLTYFATSAYAREDVMQYLAQQWPAPFFSNVVISILPVQMVAFGALGSVAGYWMAFRYDYWRKHESK